MLRCEECRCISSDARGWLAHIVEDEENPAAGEYVVVYCPACANREFHREPRSPFT